MGVFGCRFGCECRVRMIYVCCLQEVKWRGQDAGDEGQKI